MLPLKTRTRLREQWDIPNRVSVRRKDNAAGLRARWLIKRLKLTQGHKQARLDWSLERLNWNAG